MNGSPLRVTLVRDRSAEPADLLDAVRLIARGEPLLSPKATKALIARYLAVPDPTSASPPELKTLTECESQVLGLVAVGLSNDAIGKWLHVSPLTVKTHVNRIMAKLGARDRAHLVVIARQTGFASPSSPRPGTTTSGRPVWIVSEESQEQTWM